MQKFGHLFPNHLSPQMENWSDKYEYHLLLKLAGDSVAKAQGWLNEFFKSAESGFLRLYAKSKVAHRFATPSAVIRYQAIHADENERYPLAGYRPMP